MFTPEYTIVLSNPSSINPFRITRVTPVRLKCICMGCFPLTFISSVIQDGVWVVGYLGPACMQLCRAPKMTSSQSALGPPQRYTEQRSVMSAPPATEWAVMGVGSVGLWRYALVWWYKVIRNRPRARAWVIPIGYMQGLGSPLLKWDMLPVSGCRLYQWAQAQCSAPSLNWLTPKINSQYRPGSWCLTSSKNYQLLVLLQ